MILGRCPGLFEWALISVLSNRRGSRVPLQADLTPTKLEHQNRDLGPFEVTRSDVGFRTGRSCEYLQCLPSLTARTNFCNNANVVLLLHCEQLQKSSAPVNGQ